MPYQVLYRKYRPKTFLEVVGQDHIVKTLKNAIDNDKISHAYLFCGPRGTGKTTIAKLFAKALNCLSSEDRPCGECPNCQAMNEGSFPDVIELDAASNNSVEDIRNIVENASYRPLQGRYKVYILDEVHMLSGSAANALLKTLEEPPAHVIFILATTDPQKIIPTILSRCQRYNFSKVSDTDMKRRLEEILKKEGLEYEAPSLDIICDLADGCVRDALSYLDEALAYSEGLKTSELIEMFGLLTLDKKMSLIKDIKAHRLDDALVEVRDLYRKGIDIKALTQDLIKIFKDLLIYKETGSIDLLSVLDKKRAQEIATLYDTHSILSSIDILLSALDAYRKGQDVLSSFEVVIFKLANIKEEAEIKISKATVFDEEIEIERPKKKEDIELDLDELVLTKEELLSVLKTASKEEKNKDLFIYEDLRELSFDPKKRKYFSLLKDTEIFADNKDMIILFTYSNEALVHQINDKMNNQELYYFLNDEFGIDKMVYAINKEVRDDIARSFRNIDDYDLNGIVIERYPKKEGKKDLEAKLKEVFGDVEVMED